MSTSNDQLFFSSKQPQYKLSPLVVLSILNHYQRRPIESPSQELDVCDYVVGLLFGTKDKSSIYVTSSFPLCVYQTKKGAMTLPPDQITRVVDLHFQGHIKDEKLVGWYKTGTIAELPMHKLLQGDDVKIGSKRKLNENELLQLLVDTELSSNTMRVKGYVASPVVNPLELYRRINSQQASESKEDSATTAAKRKKGKKVKKTNEIASNVQIGEAFWKCEPVVVDYLMEKSEEIVFHTTLNTPPDGTALDAPSTLLSDLGHLENTLEDLVDSLTKVSEYVQSIKDSNTTSIDLSLGWDIAQALSAIPTISPNAFEKILSNRLQDLLMLAYLGKLTHTQLKVADKINQVLHQTIQT